MLSVGRDNRSYSNRVWVVSKRWTRVLGLFLCFSVVVGFFPAYAKAKDDIFAAFGETEVTADETEAEAGDEEGEEAEAERLLERQRRSLNRPFSITPSETPESEADEEAADNTESEGTDSREVAPPTDMKILPVPPVGPNLPQSSLPDPEKDSLLHHSPSADPAEASGLLPNAEPKTRNVPAVVTTTEGSLVPLGPEVASPTVGLLHPPLLLTPAQPLEQPIAETLDTRYSVPMVYNEHVEAYINLFQTRLRDRFSTWLARSGQYLPMMQKILKKNDLPEDLAFLPLIESGFNPKAYSRAKAAGPWQFIQPTGKLYGLRVNKWIDERRDPVKSTVAAANYLKNLYGIFQSWALSLASYNAGEGKISRAMTTTRAEDFWELKESDHIRNETKDYVPKFMAATIIAKDPKKYGFFIDYHAPLVYEEVSVPTATSLKTIAKAAGVSVDKIKFYNPELKLDTTPPNYPGYRLKVPPGTRETVAANLAKKKVRVAKKKPGASLSKAEKPKVKIHKKKLRASKRQIAATLPRKKRA